MVMTTSTHEGFAVLRMEAAYLDHTGLTIGALIETHDTESETNVVDLRIVWDVS